MTRITTTTTTTTTRTTTTEKMIRKVHFGLWFRRANKLYCGPDVNILAITGIYGPGINVYHKLPTGICSWPFRRGDLLPRMLNWSCRHSSVTFFTKPWSGLTKRSAVMLAPKDENSDMSVTPKSCQGKKGETTYQAEHTCLQRHFYVIEHTH